MVIFLSQRPLEIFEKWWLEQFPDEIKPVYYRR